MRHNRLSRVRARRHEWNDDDVDDGVTRRTQPDRRVDHRDAGCRRSTPGSRRSGTERRRRRRRRRRARRPASATSQRAAVDEWRDAGSRRQRCRRIPGDVQVRRSVRRHKDETLLDVQHQSKGASSLSVDETLNSSVALAACITAARWIPKSNPVVITCTA